VLIVIDAVQAHAEDVCLFSHGRGSYGWPVSSWFHQRGVERAKERTKVILRQMLDVDAISRLNLHQDDASSTCLRIALPKI